MKVCFIGACGHWAQALNYLKTRKGIEFCGFAEGSPEEKMEASIDPQIPFFKDYQAMLDEVKPDLAVVSPVFGLTGRVIIECAKRKINVFAEKPVAASFKELEKVEQAIEESGIRFCAMHYLRYEPAFYQAARMVKEGKIGDIRMITAQKSYKYGVRPAWYSDPSLYCGTIAWVGIHALDWIAQFSGKKFVSVTAKTWGKNPEMAALCQFQMEDGIIASANIDYYRPETALTHGDDRVRCVGTDGVIEVCEGKISLINKEGNFTYCPREAPELLAEFLDGGEGISVSEILHITKAAIAAQESAQKEKEEYI